MKHEEAVQVIADGRGSLFDPDIVEAFLEIHESIRLIKEQCSDEHEFTGQTFPIFHSNS